MKKLLIKSVNFKNFLSYGDYNNKIDFTRKQMTLINGKNGNGKCLHKNSTININISNEETYRKFIEWKKEKVDSDIY